MTQRPSQSLIGVHHLGFDDVRDEAEFDARTKQMLARALNIKSVIAFVGSGVSVNYQRQNTWEHLVGRLVAYTLSAPEGEAVLSKTERQTLTDFLVWSSPPKTEPAHDGRGTVQPASRLARIDRFLMALDLSEESCLRAGLESRKKYREQITLMVPSEDADYKPRVATVDPLRLIITRFGIRRFLTTNYDRLIENALTTTLAMQHEHPALGDQRTSRQPGARIVRSLSNVPGAAASLSQFAASAPDYDCGVFHLHGTARDSVNMIVTERDYQRVYLQQGAERQAFREALQVALAGNAILFLGLGMEEADLLRPLRQFVSEETRGGFERPLFALLPSEDKYSDNERREFRHYLYTRYGVKTLFYPVENGDIGSSFCHEIERLSESWTGWWRNWQQKPTLREPKFRLENSDDMPEARHNSVMIRHFVEPVGMQFRPSPDVDRDALMTALQNGASVVVALGSAGTAKGSLGQEIARAGVPSLSGKSFFASAHFSNDFLSIVDAAANFFLGTGRDVTATAQGPIDRLAGALRTGSHLMVIGGFERLLTATPIDREDRKRRGGRVSRRRSRTSRTLPALEAAGADYPLAVGRPLTPDVRDFLRFLKQFAFEPRAEGYGAVVLTSSVMPRSLCEKLIPVVQLQGITEATLLTDERFEGRVDASLISELHYTLRGHAYALAIIGAALEANEDLRARNKWVRRLIGRLTAIDLASRPTKAAEIAIDEALLESSVRKRHTPAAPPTPEKRSLSSVLERTALFTTPVTAHAVLETLPKTDGWTLDEVTTDLELLQQRRLLLRIKYEEDQPRWRTTAHTIVRNYVLTRMGASPDMPGEPHRFELAGWTSETPPTLVGVDRGHAATISSVDAVLARIENDSLLNDTQRRHMIRAAFGLIRSRWTATVIPRLASLDLEPTLRLPRPHYDSYQRRLARLLNAIRDTVTDEGWTTGHEDPARIENKDGILYADELAWLYNEMGTAAFCMGLQADAYALYRAGQHVNAVAERGKYGARWCESELNLGLVQMERGRLARAQYHFEYAVRVGRSLGIGMHGRARGHLALVHHMIGDYDKARALYDEAVRAMQATGNHRGESVFLRQRGDLYRKQGDFDAAAVSLHKSVAAAESGRHADLVQYAHVAIANLKRKRKEPVPIEDLSPAIEFARRVGIPKLESDAQLVQGQIALEHGEYEMAGQLAISTLAIASSMGLRLRVTLSLILLGRVTAAKGNFRSAIELLESSKRSADKHGNQLHYELAEQELRGLKTARARF